MHITQLAASDAPQYRELMLEAYALEIDAFTSTADERAGEALSWWEERIRSSDGRSESFGAFSELQLVGAVALEFSKKTKTKHSALVIGMYVQPAYRGLGAAVALLRAAVASATSRPEVHILRLTVTEGNQSAIRLYQAAGFVAWGTEPTAICASAGFKGKVHMWLPLRHAQSAISVSAAQASEVSGSMGGLSTEGYGKEFDGEVPKHTRAAD